MYRVLVLGGLVWASLPGLGEAQQKSKAQEIREAVSALPAPLRDGAEVRAFQEGSLAKIRDGNNGLICLADDPRDERWHVACYHASLEPFMARGRELRAQGELSRAMVDSIRLAEIESGELAFPTGPAALYSLTGSEGDFDTESGEAPGTRSLHVIYVPYATEASLGISTRPSRERPWLMTPGKPWAHVMISR